MTRVHGPYRHGDRWRIVHRDQDGRQHYQAFDSWELALEERARLMGPAAEPDDALLARLSAPVRLPVDPLWIYMLHDAAGSVVYVGSTRDPDGRLHDHRANGVPFCYMSVHPEVLEREVGLSVELALIRKLNPPLNRSGKAGRSLGHATERTRKGATRRTRRVRFLENIRKHLHDLPRSSDEESA